MAEGRKRREIKKYFKGRGHFWAWFLIVTGLLTLGMGVGLLLIVAGIVVRFWKTESQQEGQVDSWTDEDFQAHNHVARALELCNFANYEREPVLIRGIAGAGLSDNVFHSQRLGNDGKLRTTPIAATVLLCGPDQLGIYQTGIDLTTGNCVNETIWEVFYQDVTSVGASSNSYTIDFKEVFKKFLGYRFFIGNPLASATIGSFLRTSEAKEKGFTANNFKKAYIALETRYGRHLLGEMLQREVTKTYHIDLSDGSKIQITTTDERATREANTQNEAAAGNEVARSMLALREFVREKKRQLLHRVRAGGTGALI
jgi:hypothetical protein